MKNVQIVSRLWQWEQNRQWDMIIRENNVIHLSGSLPLATQLWADSRKTNASAKMHITLDSTRNFILVVINYGACMFLVCGGKDQWTLRAKWTGHDGNVVHRSLFWLHHTSFHLVSTEMCPVLKPRLKIFGPQLDAPKWRLKRIQSDLPERLSLTKSPFSTHSL